MIVKLISRRFWAHEGHRWTMPLSLAIVEARRAEQVELPVAIRRARTSGQSVVFDSGHKVNTVIRDNAKVSFAFLAELASGTKGPVAVRAGARAATMSASQVPSSRSIWSLVIRHLDAVGVLVSRRWEETASVHVAG